MARFDEKYKYCPDVLAAVVNNGRSGSHYLIHCLSNHPDIHAPREEVWGSRFRRHYPASGQPSVEYMLGMTYCVRGYKAAVAKFNYRRTRESHLGVTFKENDFKVIHLKRRNYVRQGVSGYLAKNRRVYHADDEDNEPTVDRIDPKWMVRQCRKYEKREERFDNIISSWGLDSIEVIYENLLFDGEGTTSHQIPEGEAKRICDFLDVGYYDLYQTRMHRTVGLTLPEMIGNWDEIEARIARTKYAYCLETI